MKKFQIIKPLATVAAVALMLTGCAGSGSPGGSSDSETVTYWSMWQEGEPQQKVIAKAIEAFESETGIAVKAEWQGRTNVEKLIPALNTNKVPDIIDGAYNKLAPSMAGTGQAHGMTAAYSTKVDGVEVSELIPAKYLETSAIFDEQGKPWMLPYSLSSDGMWFDASAHPEIAAAPPQTWDEFVSVLDALKADGHVPLAADGDISDYNAAWFYTAMIRQEGVGAFNALVSDESGESWESDDVAQVVEMMESIVNGGYLDSGYSGSKWPAQQQVWADGQAAIMFNGSWLPTETGTYAKDGFEYSSFPFPTVDGSAPAIRADFVGTAIPAKAANKEAAEEFAAFLLTKEYQDAYGTEANVLPIRDDAETSPQMATIKSAMDSATEVYLRNDGVSYAGYMDKTFWPINDRFFLGKLSGNEFIDEMKKAQITYWENND